MFTAAAGPHHQLFVFRDNVGDECLCPAPPTGLGDIQVPARLPRSPAIPISYTRTPSYFRDSVPRGGPRHLSPPTSAPPPPPPPPRMRSAPPARAQRRRYRGSPPAPPQPEVAVGGRRGGAGPRPSLRALATARRGGMGPAAAGSWRGGYTHTPHVRLRSAPGAARRRLSLSPRHAARLGGGRAARPFCPAAAGARRRRSFVLVAGWRRFSGAPHPQPPVPPSPALRGGCC